MGIPTGPFLIDFQCKLAGWRSRSEENFRRPAFRSRFVIGSGSNHPFVYLTLRPAKLFRLLSPASNQGPQKPRLVRWASGRAVIFSRKYRKTRDCPTWEWPGSSCNPEPSLPVREACQSGPRLPAWARPGKLQFVGSTRRATRFARIRLSIGHRDFGRKLASLDLLSM
jgi:hypothetical protein